MCGLISLPSAATAQVPNPGAAKAKGPIPKPDYDQFNMETKVGSFKMMEFNDDKQPEGHFVMSFTGTVLVDTSDSAPNPRLLKTVVHTEGGVKLEKRFHGRDMYFGTGKIIVDGGWHALEWFGRDMTASFFGCGVFRLTGEFDRELNTGSYWYSDGKKMDWGTGGNQPDVPKSQYIIANPKIKINGKG